MSSIDIFESSKSKTIQIIGPCPFNINLIVDLPTIFIDGGIQHRQRIQDSKTLSVGDGDSNQTQYKLDIPFKKDKSFSDLQGSFQYIPDFVSEINLLGFLGERADHEFSNILELFSLCKQRHNFVAKLEDSIEIFSPGTYHINHNGLISCYTFEDNLVSIEGDIKYPLRQEKITPLSSHGLSNEAHGDVSLEVSKSPLVIFKN